MSCEEHAHAAFAEERRACVPPTKNLQGRRDHLPSPPEVIPVIVNPVRSFHTDFMQRIIEEAEYVLVVLCQMRDQVVADPTLFDSDAQERIAKAIIRTENVIRLARLQRESTKREIKAA